jgi:chromosome segregation ATPase
MDNSQEIAVKLAQMESKIESIADSLDEVKRGLIGLGDLREELAKFAIHHEQFRNESKTMWARIDQQRDDLKVLNSTIDNWKGRLQNMGIVCSFLACLGGGVLAWTAIQVVSIPVMQEKINQLELQQRGK